MVSAKILIEMKRFYIKVLLHWISATRTQVSKIKVLIILSDAALHRSPEQQLTLHSPAPLHMSTFSMAKHASSVKQLFPYSSTDTPPFLMSTLILAQRL